MSKQQQLIWLPPKVREKLHRLAKKEYRSVSSYVTDLIDKICEPKEDK